MDASSHPTDRELMRRVQLDDAEAFGVLYDRLAPTAARIARPILRGDPERAAEAVQEGFLSVWRARDQYRPELGEVHSWAYGIVRNRAIDSLRRNGRDAQRQAGAVPIHDRGPAPADASSGVVAQEDAHALRLLLRDLPAAQREVIALAYFGELSHSQIAARLAIPLGTVKGRMRLGLNKLRERLAA